MRTEQMSSAANMAMDKMIRQQVRWIAAGRVFNWVDVVSRKNNSATLYSEL